MNWFKNALGLKVSKDEFVELAKREIKQRGTNAELVYNPDDFSIGVRESDGAINKRFFLSNVYGHYCMSRGAARKQLLDVYFGLVEPQLPKTLEEALPNLLPRVQARAHFEEMSLYGQSLHGGEQGQEGTAVPYMTMGEHLAECVVFDTEQSVMQISESMYADWHTSQQELRAHALANLKKLTPNAFQQISEGTYAPTYADTYDATRMLLRERLAECRTEGRCVVMVCNRDTLIITGEDDTAGHALMVRAAEEALQMPRPILMVPFVLDQGRWSELKINDDHPLRSRFQKLRTASFADFYQVQKELMERDPQQRFKDVFIATYMVAENAQEGKMFSATTWTQDVEKSLLPKTDIIVFVSAPGEEHEETCFVPWHVAQEIVGDAMKPASMYPERVLVESFPTAEQFAQLKKHETRD